MNALVPAPCSCLAASPCRAKPLHKLWSDASVQCAVIHAGIYYEPGSLKAQMCVRGKELLYKYTREHSIAHSQLGKVVTCRCAAAPVPSRSARTSRISTSTVILLPLRTSALCTMF